MVVGQITTESDLVLGHQVMDGSTSDVTWNGMRWPLSMYRRYKRIFPLRISLLLQTASWSVRPISKACWTIIFTSSLTFPLTLIRSWRRARSVAQVNDLKHGSLSVRSAAANKPVPIATNRFLSTEKVRGFISWFCRAVRLTRNPGSAWRRKQRRFRLRRSNWRRSFFTCEADAQEELARFRNDPRPLCYEDQFEIICEVKEH